MILNVFLLLNKHIKQRNELNVGAAWFCSALCPCTLSHKKWEKECAFRVCFPHALYSFYSLLFFFFTSSAVVALKSTKNGKAYASFAYPSYFSSFYSFYFCLVCKHGEWIGRVRNRTSNQCRSITSLFVQQTRCEIQESVFKEAGVGTYRFVSFQYKILIRLQHPKSRVLKTPRRLSDDGIR